MTTILKLRARAWCFTCFDFEERYEKILLNLQKSKYYIIGKEICKSTNREHLQGYVYFNNAITGKSLQKKLGANDHIEVAKGSPEDNKTYCSKENNFIEVGTIPQQGKRTDLNILKMKL